MGYFDPDDPFSLGEYIEENHQVKKVVIVHHGDAIAIAAGVLALDLLLVIAAFILR